MSDGPRPYRVATTTMPSKYTMTRFASSKNGKVSHAAPVASAVTAMAQPYGAQSDGIARRLKEAGGTPCCSRSALMT